MTASTFRLERMNKIMGYLEDESKAMRKKANEENEAAMTSTDLEKFRDHMSLERYYRGQADGLHAAMRIFVRELKLESREDLN